MKRIILENVSKEIHGNQVLDEVSLELDSGKIYIFKGKNGSGKTMLLRAIAGLIRPTSGTVIIDGKTLHEDIDYPPSIGVVIENPEFWRDYTGCKTMQVLAKIKGIASEEDIVMSMKRIGLNPQDKRRIRAYSLGMKQRLGIAQAIMEKPDILLFDEPTNALDREGVKLFNEIIGQEASRGATVIIASHVFEDIIGYTDVFEMESGRLV